MKKLMTASALCIGMLSCGPAQQGGMEYWLTTGDQQVLLRKQAALPTAAEPVKEQVTLSADTAKTFQTVDGFGYTLTGGNVTRNVAYYIIAHASKFITPGSVRVDSHQEGPLHSAAFLRPDGKTVMVVLNDSDAPVSFNLQQHGQWVSPSLPAGSTGTFVW